jgi:putative endonuclease
LPRTGRISGVTARPRACNLIRMSADSKSVRGAAAERLAAEYLQTQGLAVLAQNLRCRTGELDLVCLDRRVLVIVEVRQRIRSEFGGALASVDGRKQRKLIRAARYFLQRRPEWRDYAVRFDVVGMAGQPSGTYRMMWIKNAFRAT